MPIRLLVAAKRSGKTTGLLRWATRRGDVGGVLAPDRRGLRVLYFPATAAACPFQLPPGQPAPPGDRSVSVGRFRFLASAFAKTRDVLRRDAADPRLAWVVVDEAGPLELRGGGLDATLRELLPLAAPPGHPLQLWVVREDLADSVRARYGLGEVRTYSSPTQLPGPPSPP